MYTSRHAGFTLIELMVTIAVAVVLMGVAAPALQDMIASQKVRAAASELMTDMSYARADAVSNGRQVALVRMSSVWAGGWSVIACVPPAVNAACAPLNACDPTTVTAPCIEEPIRRTALGGRVKLCTRMAASVIDTPALVFNSDGSVIDTAGGVGLHINSVMVSDDMGDADWRNDKLRSLDFGPTGRVSLHDVVAAAGVACP